MAFRFDKLTTKAQGLVAEAQGQAASAGNPEIDPLHLLAAMLAESEGITRPLLQKINVDTQQLTKLVTAELSRLPSVSGGRQPSVSPALQKVFDAAAESANVVTVDEVDRVAAVLTANTPRVPVLKPLWVHLQPFTRCNQHCIHCYCSGGPKADPFVLDVQPLQGWRQFRPLLLMAGVGTPAVRGINTVSPRRGGAGTSPDRPPCGRPRFAPDATPPPGPAPTLRHCLGR
jgi:hypothetical protein